MLRISALVLSTCIGLAAAGLSATGARAELGPNDGMNPYPHAYPVNPPPVRVYRGAPHGHYWHAPRPHRHAAPRYGYYPPYAAPGWERPRFRGPFW